MMKREVVLYRGSADQVNGIGVTHKARVLPIQLLNVEQQSMKACPDVCALAAVRRSRADSRYRGVMGSIICSNHSD
jgi:hypothetical protein